MVLITSGFVTMALIISIAIMLNADMEVAPIFFAPDFVASHIDCWRILLRNWCPFHVISEIVAYRIALLFPLEFVLEVINLASNNFSMA